MSSLKEPAAEAAAEKTTDGIVKGAVTSICAAIFDVISTHKIVFTVLLAGCVAVLLIRKFRCKKPQHSRHYQHRF